MYGKEHLKQYLIEKAKDFILYKKSIESEMIILNNKKPINRGFNRHFSYYKSIGERKYEIAKIDFILKNIDELFDSIQKQNNQNCRIGKIHFDK